MQYLNGKIINKIKLLKLNFKNWLTNYIKSVIIVL